jgi:hypothetical protein
MSTTTATAIRYYEEEKRRYSCWIEHPQGTNDIGVLPGKFSFFHPVAYQKYLRIRALLQLDRILRRPIAATPRLSNWPGRWWPRPIMERFSRPSSTMRQSP